MVMPERLPSALSVSPDVAASPRAAARGEAAPVVATAEFIETAKRRSFTAKVPIRRGPPAMLAFWGLGTVVMDAHNDGLHHVGQITDRGSCGGRQRSPSPLVAF